MSALIDATALETAKYVNKMTVTVFVTNTGSEFVKLLKAGSVLDSDLPTRSPVRGSMPPTTVPDVLANKVGSISDFFKDKVHANSATFSLSGDLWRPALTLKRAEDACDDNSKSSFFDLSYTEAKELATTASFGWDSTSDVASTQHWQLRRHRGWRCQPADEDGSSRARMPARGLGRQLAELNCNDEMKACSNGDHHLHDQHFLLRHLYGQVYFCDMISFDEVETMRLCSGTTVNWSNIHELASGSYDLGHGCKIDRGLSERERILNTDNLICFTDQMYANAQG
ncbi:hypothetical protein BD626DRAFT_564288 [Schizophyllum amplum]|uniref:Uncharacterized protein n=1 Tax=Schizophyllum amplum TaxID=97359 RepID=A0A550CR93_9AGAR|nr:hypothetical protein BD626DRAFT_564288 [Auriculariopsis ampla]